MNKDNEITAPRYEHDCTVCQFLGHKDNFDVYICPPIPVREIYQDPDIVELECVSPLEHSLIARYGNSGPDYMSADLLTVLHGGRDSILGGCFDRFFDVFGITLEKKVE